MLTAIRSKVGSVQKSRFARDAIFLQIGAGVSMGANLVTSVLLFRFLGAEQTGRYFESVNLVTLLYFIGNVGFSQVAVARIATDVGRGDHASVVRWLGLFLKAHGSFTLLVTTVGALLCPFLGVLFRMGWEVGIYASLLSVSGLLLLPFYLTQCALQGTRRMKLLAEMENLKEITRAYCVLVGAVVFESPVGAVVGEVAASVLAVPLAAICYQKARRETGVPLPSLREILRAAPLVPWAEIRAIGRASVSLSLQKNFTALAGTIFPRLMLSYFWTAREVAFLNLAQNLMKIPLLGLQGVSRTIVPVLGQMRGSGDVRGMRKALLRIMFLSGSTITLVTAAWGIALYWIIPTLYTDSALPTLPLIPWLFAAMSIAGFAVGVEGFYLISDRLDLSFKLSFLTFVCSIPPGIACVYFWGAPGAAMYILFNHFHPAFLIFYALRYMLPAKS